MLLLRVYLHLLLLHHLVELLDGLDCVGEYSVIAQKHESSRYRLLQHQDQIQHALMLQSVGPAGL